jgi:hypothetical protein
MRNLITILLILIGGNFIFAQPTTTLKVTSANSFVEDKFDWAIEKALSFVKVGQAVAGYAAAMDTSQFCARDVSHMAEGAHLLGLDTENWEMLYAFAYGANRRVTQDFYWPRWHYKFDGSDLYDFGSCQWRCLPTTFDVMQSCYRQYLWTADDNWINDDEMFTYYSNTHDYTKFMQYQDVNSNGVADETIQLATYWEQSGDNFIEAADAITYQYLALLDYSKILEARGDIIGAAYFAGIAADLKDHFETEWYSEDDRMYRRGFDIEGNSKTDWGRESTFLMPYSQISDLGPKTEKYLDFITENIYAFGINIEATTYLAEIFYLHGRKATGWHFLKGLMASMNSYPEVSYLIINNTIRGLMGVRPDAPDNKFYTLPKLSPEVPWIQAEHIPIGDNDLTIRHDGTMKSTVTNNSGAAITWEAQFYGEYETITIEGVPVTVNTKSEWGKTISYVTTSINISQTIVIEATDPIDPGYVFLSDINWTTNNNTANTRKDFNTVGNLLFMDGNKSYEKGLGVLSNTEITYDISGDGYKSFITDIGVDDEVENNGSVTFEIWLDGVKVYDSGLMTGNTPTNSIAIDIDGGNTLKLVVTDGGNGTDSDYADWADARLNDEFVSILSLNYEGITGGNENGICDPGETLAIGLKVENTGNIISAPLISTCTAIGDNTNYVTVNNPLINLEVLSPNDSILFAHNIFIDDNATVGGKFKLRFEISDGATTIEMTKEFFITDMYLSDTEYTYAYFQYGSLVKDASINNNPITLNGVTYEKGLGVHASCEIRYDLGGSFMRFFSDVGIDDEVSENGSVTFEVWTDGVKVYDSGLMEPETPTESIDLDVTGVDELKLIVTDGGNGINSDHADWAGAIVSSQSNSQPIPLSIGYSFVSSRIIPENPDMIIVMADILNENLDFVRNSQGEVLRKIGPNWVNNIGDWIISEGYLIKMFATDSFTIEGVAVDPSTPIPLSFGFQFVSYFPEAPMDALITFETILNDDLDFIRNSLGEVLRKIGPNWVNGIGDCNPGEGYLVKMFAAGEIVYPEVAKSSGKVNAIPTHFNFKGGNAADPVYTIYITGLEIGDEVAAYNGEKLIGAMKINSMNVLDNDLPVFNTINNGQGYTPGKPITLKVWSKNEVVNTDFTMEAVFDSYVSDVYPDEDGEYSLVNITKGASIWNNEILVYPNPATDEINISSSETVRNVMILNYAGQLVYEGNNTKINTTNFNSGIYIIRIKTDNGVETQKFTIK